MTGFFQRLKDETGAVTVDWVVIVALGVALAIPALGTLGRSTQSAGDEINATLTQASLFAFGATSVVATTREAGPAAVDFTYKRITATEELFAAWIDSWDGAGDAQVIGQYSHFLHAVERAIEAHDDGEAGYYLDAAASAREAMARRGHSLPDAGQGLVSLVQAYETAFQ